MAIGKGKKQRCRKADVFPCKTRCVPRYHPTSRKEQHCRNVAEGSPATYLQWIQSQEKRKEIINNRRREKGLTLFESDAAGYIVNPDKNKKGKLPASYRQKAEEARAIGAKSPDPKIKALAETTAQKAEAIAEKAESTPSPRRRAAKQKPGMPYNEFWEKMRKEYFEERRRQELRGVVAIEARALLDTVAKENNVPPDMANRYYKRIRRDGSALIVMENQKDFIVWEEKQAPPPEPIEYIKPAPKSFKEFVGAFTDFYKKELPYQRSEYGGVAGGYISATDLLSDFQDEYAISNEAGEKYLDRLIHDGYIQVDGTSKFITHIDPTPRPRNRKPPVDKTPKTISKSDANNVFVIAKAFPIGENDSVINYATDLKHAIHDKQVILPNEREWVAFLNDIRSALPAMMDWRDDLPRDAHDLSIAVAELRGDERLEFINQLKQSGADSTRSIYNFIANVWEPQRREKAANPAPKPPSKPKAPTKPKATAKSKPAPANKTKTKPSQTTMTPEVFEEKFREVYVAEKIRQERRSVVAIHADELLEQFIEENQDTITPEKAKEYFRKLKNTGKILSVMEKGNELIRWAL